MAANTSQVNVFSYSGTNVTTNAYVTLLNSTPYTVSKLLISDSSGQLVKIAYGLPGSEVDIFSCAVSGSIVVPYYLPQGVRLAVKAISATASTGFNVVSFLQ